LAQNYNETDSDKRKMDEEEIKIVYVACSRPRKLLWLAVSSGEHKSIWEQKLMRE
jgi:ATP-dependent exoDNAse (exonuclease V) beta subunit